MKTLESKFNVYRIYKEDFRVRLTIMIIDSDKEPQEVIYDKQFTGIETMSGPEVFKHTSQQMEYDGTYELCVEVLEIQSPSVLV